MREKGISELRISPLYGGKLSQGVPFLKIYIYFHYEQGIEEMEKLKESLAKEGFTPRAGLLIEE